MTQLLGHRKSPLFIFHNALDNILRELCSEGVGSEMKEAQPFTKEAEASLWETGVLSTENAKGLLHAVFFLNGKKILFARGGGTLSAKIEPIEAVHRLPQVCVHRELI